MRSASSAASAGTPPCCDRCFKLREEVLIQRLNAFAAHTNSIRTFNQSGLVIDLDQRFQIE
jgi:hypothetical protein